MKYPTLKSVGVITEMDFERIDKQDRLGRRITIHNMDLEKFAALTERQRKIVIEMPTLAVGWDTGMIQIEAINAYDREFREREEAEKEN